MTVWTVGPTDSDFTTIQDAVNAAAPGDTIDVASGTYTDNFVTIRKSLTLQAVGGEVKLIEDTSPPDRKAMITEGQAGISVTIIGFDISGVAVSANDGNNGAAIRYEGGTLNLVNDYFHNNQEGLLGAADQNGSISINHSEFAFNGDGSGSTHNIYVGAIANFSITNSYIHDAIVGHEIKSRAANNTITGNRIFDNNGTASYSVDLPNGGSANISGNVIEQGPNTQNPAIFAYGEEGNTNGGSASVHDNTIVNDDAGGKMLFGGPIAFTNNQLWNITVAGSGNVDLATRPSLDTSPIDTACYARGTMIRTPAGDVPIQKLRPGKQVITLIDGEEVPQTVTWLGHRRIDLAGHPRPETVAPIRIRRDAFADGMPHRDLVVSPDHAVFVDGKLICARQLVNGTTIRQERDWTAVDYYHVELDQHAILLAEGLPAESYIDTGNSGFFANSGAPLVLHPDLTDETDYPTREAGSCAPFVWDEASVQPVWQRLADRAAAIGRPVPQRVTTTETDLRVFTKRPSRRISEPVYRDSNLVIFVLPSRSAEVQLLSRAQSPTEARPWLDDRRRLGVRVKRIVLRGSDEVREIPVDHPDLTRGWWAVEREGQVLSRWTDGEAVLPLPAMRGTVMLEIHLAGSMIYAVDAAPQGGIEQRAAA